MRNTFEPTGISLTNDILNSKFSLGTLEFSLKPYALVYTVVTLILVLKRKAIIQVPVTQTQCKG